MKEQIEAAVKWWSDQLRTIAPQENGDRTQSVLATALAFLQGPVDETKVTNFESSLRGLLPGFLRQSWRPGDPQWGSYCRTLACDYGPDPLLREAAVAAGIQANCPPFPMKTVMWINPDSVSVSCGYGSPAAQLWPTPD